VVLPFVPLVNAELASLIDDGDLGVAVMVLATNFVESLSGVNPTLRTLSLAVSGVLRNTYDDLPNGHEFNDISLQPCMRSVGSYIHAFSLFQLHKIHEEAIISV
jgi:hypothetical protein